MTHLDATDGAGGSNVALDALRALAYEGPRSEVAANFREQGNECARAKRWGDAREFYTRALEVVRGEVELTGQEGEGKGEGAEVDWLDEGEGRGRVVVDVEEEERREREVEVACVGNRALCNLEMSTYFFQLRWCFMATSFFFLVLGLGLPVPRLPYLDLLLSSMNSPPTVLYIYTIISPAEAYDTN